MFNFFRCDNDQNVNSLNRRRLMPRIKEIKNLRTWKVPTHRNCCARNKEQWRPLLSLFRGRPSVLFLFIWVKTKRCLSRIRGTMEPLHIRFEDKKSFCSNFYCLPLPSLEISFVLFCKADVWTENMITKKERFGDCSSVGWDKKTHL